MKLSETSKLHVLWSEMFYLFSFTFFFTATHFHLVLVAASFSFSHHHYKIFILFFQKKMSPLFFASHSRSLSLSFSLSFAGLYCLIYLFLCLSLALYSKFVRVNLSLILWTTWIQKQFPFSVFIVIDSLVVSALQDAGGYAITRQNDLGLHLGCHTFWLSLFTLVCLWCGQTVGQT